MADDLSNSSLPHEPEPANSPDNESSSAGTFALNPPTESYDQAMEIVEAMSSLAEGQLAFERRQFELALQHYEQARLLLEQAGITDDSLRSCLEKLIACYTALGHHQEASEAQSALLKVTSDNVSVNVNNSNATAAAPNALEKLRRKRSLDDLSSDLTPRAKWSESARKQDPPSTHLGDTIQIAGAAATPPMESLSDPWELQTPADKFEAADSPSLRNSDAVQSQSELSEPAPSPAIAARRKIPQLLGDTLELNSDIQRIGETLHSQETAEHHDVSATPSVESAAPQAKMPGTEKKPLVTRTLSLPAFYDDEQALSSDSLTTPPPPDPSSGTIAPVFEANLHPSPSFKESVISKQTRESIAPPVVPAASTEVEPKAEPPKEAPKKKSLVARTLSLPNFFGLQKQESLTESESLTGDAPGDSLTGTPIQPPQTKKRRPSSTLSLPVLFAAETLTSAAETLTSAVAAMIPEPQLRDPEPDILEPAPEDTSVTRPGAEKKRRVAKTLTLPAFFTSAAETLSAAADNLNTVATNLGARPAKKKREHKNVYHGPAPGSLTRPAGDASVLEQGSFDLDPERQHNFIEKLFFLVVKRFVVYHNEDVIDAEKGRSQSWGTPWFLLLVSVIFLFGVFQITAMFNSGQAGKAKVATPKALSGARLESCDQKVWMELMPHDKCVVHRHNSNTEAKFMILPDNPDPMSLFRSYLSRRELWFQLESDSVTDDEKIVMYRQDSPEMAIVKKMKWYGAFFQQLYQESQTYPSITEQIRKLDPHYGYTNPFTGKGEYATILLQIRPNNSLDFVDRIITERSAHPGEIFCICLNSKIFVIIGYDRNGKPLTSSNPEHCFLLEYQNGVKKDLPGPTEEVQSKPRSDKPTLVLFYSKPGQDTSIQWYRRFSLILLGTAVVIALLFCYVSYKTEKSQKVKDISIVAVVATVLCVVGWLLIAN